MLGGIRRSLAGKDCQSREGAGLTIIEESSKKKRKKRLALKIEPRLGERVAEGGKQNPSVGGREGEKGQNMTTSGKEGDTGAQEVKKETMMETDFEGGREGGNQT